MNMVAFGNELSLQTSSRIELTSKTFIHTQFIQILRCIYSVGVTAGLTAF